MTTVNLSIKAVPASVAAQLRMRAERNHRSLQGELMAIVERAAAEAAAPSAERAGGPAAPTSRGTKTIEEIAAEIRRRFPQPITQGPMAVDILRAERDAR